MKLLLLCADETRNNGWEDPQGPAGGMATDSLPAESWFADACLASGGERAAIQFMTNHPHAVDAWSDPATRGARLGV